MRDEEHPLRGVGAKSGEHVGQSQRVAKRRHVREGHRLHGIGPCPEVLDEPGERLLVRLRSGDARTEGDLAIDKAVGERTIEVVASGLRSTLTGSER
jgi:hypothetical protein